MSHPLHYREWASCFVQSSPSRVLVFHKDEPSAAIRQFFEFSEPSTSLLKKERNDFRTWTIRPRVGNLVPRASQGEAMGTRLIRWVLFG